MTTLPPTELLEAVAPAVEPSAPLAAEEDEGRLVGPLANLPALEAALKAKGFPPLSRWWRRSLASFYRSKKRQLVVRVGRRGGKSSTLCRIAVLEALFGDHVIPPGDVGVVAIISVSRDEANQRLRTIKSILDALGVKWKPVEGGIELEGRPIVFKTFAASISGVSGFTCICAICDEVAKWRDSDTGANPATEVLASLRPTMADQPNARIFLSSSAMGRLDAHAVAFDLGATPFQEVASAKTWEARPELTEADCRALEPDFDIFNREYGNNPFDGSALSLYTESGLLDVTRKGVVSVPYEAGVQYFAAQDPANRGGNGWTLVLARSRSIGEDLNSISIVCAREWRAPRGGALDSDSTLHSIAQVLHEYHVEILWTDQWSYDALTAIASRHGIDLRQEPSTQVSKVKNADAFKRRVDDRLVEIVDIPLVRSDLLGVRKWISRAGGFTIELERQGGRHSDFAPAVLLALSKAAEDAGGVPDMNHKNFVKGVQAFLRGEPDTPRRLPPSPGGHYDPRALTCTTDYIRAQCEVRGNNAFDGMTASYGRNTYIQFSPNSSQAFKDRVALHRSQNG